MYNTVVVKVCSILHCKFIYLVPFLIVPHPTGLMTHTWIHGMYMCMCVYTGCPRRNAPEFGRVFLMLKYTDITQNTYVQSWTVTEIMASEKCGHLAGPNTVPASWQSYPFPSSSVVSYDGNSAHAKPLNCTCTCFSVMCSAVYSSVVNGWQVSFTELLKCLLCFPTWNMWHEFCIWVLRWQCTCCCRRIPKAFSRSKDSVSKCIYANSPDIACYWFSSKCFCAVWKGGVTND